MTANSFVKKPGGAAPVGIITPVLTAGQHGGSNRRVDEPHHTITASKKDQNAILVPTLVGCGGRAGQSRPRGGDEPTATVTAKADVCVATAFMAQHNNDSRRDGGVNPGRPMDEPVSTVTQTGSQQGVIAASLLSMKGSDRRDSDLNEPHPTVLAGGLHSALVTPFMTKYYGTGDGAMVNEPAHTVTMKDRFAYVEGAIAPPPLDEAQVTRARTVADFMRGHGFWDDREFVTVTIGPDLYTIVDIGMRMLTPRELFGAQGFPADYIIDPIYNGKPLSKSDQIGCCGNSVSPPMAASLIAANCSDLMVYREAAE